MNRSELLTAWALRLSKTAPSSMDATTQARAIGFFNQRHRRLLSLPGLRHLRETTVTFDSVADQVAYVLANVAKVKLIRDTTNQRVLYEMSQQDQRLIDPIPISGTPEAVIWMGKQAVAVQPSDASSVFVVSSSAADTTQTCYVEGTVTGNYPRSASVTLTGQTAVDLSASITTWESITKFYLSAVAAGTVTLTEDSGGGTTLAQITIGKTNTDYTGFSLWPTPSDAITYEVDVTRAITDLAQDTDEPLLPEDFHDVLLLGAVMDEYQHLSDNRYGVAASEYAQRVKEMQYWLHETAIGQPFSLTRGWQKPSQLGSFYPAGS